MADGRPNGEGELRQKFGIFLAEFPARLDQRFNNRAQWHAEFFEIFRASRKRPHLQLLGYLFELTEALTGAAEIVIGKFFKNPIGQKRNLIGLPVDFLSVDIGTRGVNLLFETDRVVLTERFLAKRIGNIDQFDFAVAPIQKTPIGTDIVGGHHEGFAAMHERFDAVEN